MGVFQNKIFIDYYGFLQRSLCLSNVHSHDQCNICGELGWLVAAPGNTYTQLYLREKNYKFHCLLSHGGLEGPSDNLQYDMLGRWVNGTVFSLTKCLMFQSIFFSLFLEKYLLKSSINNCKEVWAQGASAYPAKSYHKTKIFREYVKVVDIFFPSQYWLQKGVSATGFSLSSQKQSVAPKS